MITDSCYSHCLIRKIYKKRERILKYKEKIVRQENGHLYLRDPMLARQFNGNKKIMGCELQYLTMAKTIIFTNVTDFLLCIVIFTFIKDFAIVIKNSLTIFSKTY